MKLTYVYHSCCAIEFKKFTVLIDYYKDVIKEGEETGCVLAP